MKKLLFVGILFFCFFIPSVSALTKWEYNSWQANDGYGKKKQVTSNITNLKGEDVEVGGMKYGPFNKTSTAKLNDGIVEEVYVGLNKENYNNGDLFEMSIALNNTASKYLTEAVVMTQKSGDNFVLTANWAKSFKATITENGVYTYKWNFKTSVEGKILVKFTILNYNEEIDTTGFIALDKDAKDATNVRYLWACNIKAPYGVDIYTELPVLESENPNTADNIFFYVLMLFLSLGSVSYLAKISRC